MDNVAAAVDGDVICGKHTRVNGIDICDELGVRRDSGKKTIERDRMTILDSDFREHFGIYLVKQSGTVKIAAQNA